MELCLRHAENPNQPALNSLLAWRGWKRRASVTGGAGLGGVYSSYPLDLVRREAAGTGGVARVACLRVLRGSSSRNRIVVLPPMRSGGSNSSSGDRHRRSRSGDPAGGGILVHGMVPRGLSSWRPLV